MTDTVAALSAATVFLKNLVISARTVFAKGRPFRHSGHQVTVTVIVLLVLPWNELVPV